MEAETVRCAPFPCVLISINLKHKRAAYGRKEWPFHFWLNSVDISTIHRQASSAARSSHTDINTTTMSDSGSDSDSIPDPEINFALVYAFHTFVATVDGQASVMRGDSLVLLDDANSYWWLVRVLKTDEVGYIPAENVETPWERLARLNKWRNVEVS